MTPAEMHELADELELSAAELEREARRRKLKARILRDRALKARSAA